MAHGLLDGHRQTSRSLDCCSKAVQTQWWVNKFVKIIVQYDLIRVIMLYIHGSQVASLHNLPFNIAVDKPLCQVYSRIKSSRWPISPFGKTLIYGTKLHNVVSPDTTRRGFHSVSIRTPYHKTSLRLETCGTERHIIVSMDIKLGSLARKQWNAFWQHVAITTPKRYKALYGVEILS